MNPGEGLIHQGYITINTSRPNPVRMYVGVNYIMDYMLSTTLSGTRIEKRTVSSCVAGL